MSPISISIPTAGYYNTEPFAADFYDSFAWSETLPDANADITVDVIDATDGTVYLSGLTDKTGEDLTDSSLTGKTIFLRFKLQMIAQTPVLSDYTLTASSSAVAKVGSYACILSIPTAGTATWTNTDSLGDLSAYPAAATPTQGCVGFWMYCADATSLTSMTYRIGSSASDYFEFTPVDFTSSGTYGLEDQTFSDGWNYMLCKFLDASKTGTPDMSDVDYQYLEVVASAPTSIYLDYHTISQSKFIGLNGLGDRTGSLETNQTHTW